MYLLYVSYSFAHLSNNERKLYRPPATVLTTKASSRTTRPQKRTKYSAVVTTRNDAAKAADTSPAAASVSKWLVLKTRPPMRLSTILSNILGNKWQ